MPGVSRPAKVYPRREPPLYFARVPFRPFQGPPWRGLPFTLSVLFFFERSGRSTIQILQVREQNAPATRVKKKTGLARGFSRAKANLSTIPVSCRTPCAYPRGQGTSFPRLPRTGCSCPAPRWGAAEKSHRRRQPQEVQGDRSGTGVTMGKSTKRTDQK